MLPFILTLIVVAVVAFLIIFIIVYFVKAIYKAIVKPVADGGRKLKDSSRVSGRFGPIQLEIEDEAAKRRDPNKERK